MLSSWNSIRPLGVVLALAMWSVASGAAEVKVSGDTPDQRAKRKVFSALAIDQLREAQNAVRYGQEWAAGAELVVPMPAACAARGCPGMRLEIQDEAAERFVELARAPDGAFVIQQADVDQIWARKLVLVGTDNRAVSGNISFGVRWSEDSHRLGSLGHAMVMCEVQKVQVGELSTWGRMRTLGMRSLDKMCEAGASNPVPLATRMPEGMGVVELEEGGRTERLRVDLKSKEVPEQAGRPAMVHVPLGTKNWTAAARLVYKPETPRR